MGAGKKPQRASFGCKNLVIATQRRGEERIDHRKGSTSNGTLREGEITYRRLSPQRAGGRYRGAEEREDDA